MIGPTSFRPDPAHAGHDERRPSWPCHCPATPTSSASGATRAGSSAVCATATPRRWLSWSVTTRSGPPDEVDGFTLADAQLVLARSHGFASWPRLRDYLRRSEGLRRDPTAIDDTELDDVIALDARGDEGDVRRIARAVPALACLRYDGADDPDRWARAAELVQRHPDLPRRDLFVAATLADPASLRTHLEADPGAAVRSGGPFGWPPLLYLAYSRVPQRRSARQCAAAARCRRRPRQRLPLAGGAPSVHRADRSLR